MSDGHIYDTGRMKDVEDLFHIKTTLFKQMCITKLGNDQGLFVQRGQCLIINQTFKNQMKYWRQGTEKDEIDLVRTWTNLGCKGNIMVKRDLTKQQMLSVLTDFRRKLDVTKPDFIVIVILSHGKRDKRTGTEFIMDINMNGLAIGKVKNMFIDGHQCSSMIGKPKLFFIQACRGKKIQDGKGCFPLRYEISFNSHKR